MKIFKISILFIITGCAQPIFNELHLHFQKSEMCVYTNNQNTYLGSDKSFIVFVGEVKEGKPFNVIYSKDYVNTQFPIRLNQCLKVQVSNLEFNKIYEVNIETNKNFSQRFCLKKIIKLNCIL